MIGIAALAVAPACSDDGGDCGPGDAPATLAVAGTGFGFEFGAFSALDGNDCPDPAAPAGLFAITIKGSLPGDAGILSLCVPRPDRLLDGDRTLGVIGGDGDIRFGVINAAATGCTYSFDLARVPTGTGRASGVCDNGDSPSGFAIELDATVQLKRTCGTTNDTIDATVKGRVAVARQPR